MNNRFEVEQALTLGLPADDSDSSVQELFDWWMKQARKEAEMVVPKSVKYGASSLTRLGHTLAKVAGREVQDEEAIELGIWFYALGKMERWTDAILRGGRPDDDLVLDVGIYAKMAQRNRQCGSWPGHENQAKKGNS